MRVSALLFVLCLPSFLCAMEQPTWNPTTVGVGSMTVFGAMLIKDAITVVYCRQKRVRSCLEREHIENKKSSRQKHIGVFHAIDQSDQKTCAELERNTNLLFARETKALTRLPIAGVCCLAGLGITLAGLYQ